MDQSVLTGCRTWNDTWVYNATTFFCNWTSFTACETQRGGLYDPTKSSTSRSPMDVYTAGGDSGDDSIYPSSGYATDTMAFANSSLASYGFGMPGHDDKDPYSRYV